MHNVFSEPKLYPKSLCLDKTWFVSFKDENGKEQKRYGKLNNIPSLEQRLAEAQRIIDDLNKERSLFTANSLNGSLLKYLENAVESRKAGKKLLTRYGYDSKLKVFAEWYRVSKYPPVTDHMGNNFLAWLAKRDSINSNTSINDYRRQLKSFFQDLVDFGFIAINPFSKTKKLPQRTTTKSWFRKPIQKKLKGLMSEQGDVQLWLCCMIQFYCFVRPGDEMRHLRVGDIFKDSKGWKFRLSGSSLKTGRFRFIPIPPALKSQLEDYISDADDSFYIFGKEGQPGKKTVGRNFFYNRHRIYMNQLGLGKGYSLYSWKNTGAVMMYQEGVKMKYISLLMGHSSIEITDEYFKSLGIDDVMDDVKINYPVI